MPRKKGTSARTRKPKTPPPVRDLDQLDLEEAHASEDQVHDLVLDEDDELTQWQGDPKKHPLASEDDEIQSYSADGEELLDLEEASAGPPPPSIGPDSMEPLSSDDDLDEELESTMLSGDPDSAPTTGPRPEGEPSVPPQTPLINPYGRDSESSKPQIYFDHSIDPEAGSVDGEETEMEEPSIDPDEVPEEEELDLERATGDDTAWRDEEPGKRAARMDLVHVSLDPEDPSSDLSIEDEMETDMIDLTPYGGSQDELERLEAEVEKLEEDGRLDEALTAVQQLQRFMPTDSQLQYKYDELQRQVIDSYFPGKSRESVVHLAVDPAELPELIKNAEAELGAILGRMDGATPLGELDQALPDLDPGTLYRLLSRAKGKGLIRLE